MESPLSFNSTEIFRKKLLVRNLPPYKVLNSFSADDVISNKEIVLVDYAIVDSQPLENIGNELEKKLFIKNKYNPENTNGDFGDVVSINLDKGTETNFGNYDVSDSIGSKLEKIGDSQETLLYVKNLYGPTEYEKGYGDVVLINNDLNSKSNIGKYGYPLTINSKLEQIGNTQEISLIVKNVYKPLNTTDFGDTVWFINNDQNILTTGSGEYDINDTTNSYLYQIGNTQEINHIVRNLYRPIGLGDFGDTVWYINNDQVISSVGQGEYDINDTTNSFLYQIGNTQEVYHKVINKYKPLTFTDYGSTRYDINNVLTLSVNPLFGNDGGEYNISDTNNSELEYVGNNQEIFLFTKNKYTPENGNDYGDTVWFINNDLILGTNAGNYNYGDTIGSQLETKGTDERNILFPINQYGPENTQSQNEVNPNVNLQTKPNEGNYGYPDSIGSDLENQGIAERPTLIVVNQYGPANPLNEPPNINQNLQTHSNEGEYGLPDSVGSDMELFATQKETDAYVINKYVTGVGKYEVVNLDDLQTLTTGLPYSNTDSTFVFIPSTYTPVSILTSDDPNGSDGNLSQDSALANIAAKQLQKEFKHRVALELLQQTLGKINLFNSNVDPDTGEVSAKPNTDPFNAIGLLTGNIPIIARNYRITNPDLFLGQAINFAARIAGTYSPYSYIPGEYFDYPDRKGGGIFNNPLSLLGQGVGAIFRSFQPANQSASELFVEYTSVATRSLLWTILKYNNYRPDYKIGNNLLAPPGNFYIGNRKSQLTNIVSPENELAGGKFGQVNFGPVLSYGRIGKEYEGDPITNLPFGLNSRSYIDGYGGVQAGFTWISSDNYLDPGQLVGVGLERKFEDPSVYSVSNNDPSYNKTRSNNQTFKDGSILDITQKLVDAGNKSQYPLEHVGNAINQVSKVFNDGYIELTKGSRVIRYTTKNSEGAQSITPEGLEYCRIFTKDRPYSNFDELQKTDGNIRKYTNSVLDNTFNLNIAPNKGVDKVESTNIVDGKVKKYMFSLENLAWRTSNRPGYTYEDLPACERGPNGGRIMWFPPYDLNFDESVRTQWESHTFLGRPEPIYTYSDTNRTGTLSWKIVVDHPSIMNVILDRELENATPESTITKVLDSFFAGCLKYDLYTLVQKYPMFTPRDVFDVQIAQTPEDVKKVVDDQPNETPVKSVTNDGTPVVNNTSTGSTIPPNTGSTPSTETKPDLSKFPDVGFYFHNDFPDPKTHRIYASSDFESWFTKYKNLKPEYFTGGNDGTRNFGGAVGNNIIKYGDNTYTDRTNEVLSLSNDDQVKYLATYIDWRKDEVDKFFTFIESEFDEAKKFMVEAGQILDGGDTIDIQLIGGASSVNDSNYNVDLSKRRIDAVMQWMFKLKTPKGTTFEQYYKDKKFNIEMTPSGEVGAPLEEKYKYINCSKDFLNISNEGVTSINAMACRRTKLIFKKSSYTPPKDSNTNNTTQQPQQQQTELPSSVINPTGGEDETPTNLNKPKEELKSTPATKYQDVKVRQDLTKRLARKLLTECNYFEIIRQENPMIYDGLKSKLKHFQPVFHSLTPEGLNSRLTFLQQCMRPGDTIPTASQGANGGTTLLYNDVTNSAFGAPPVCVLRIGDFFHTKIVIDSLTLKYDEGRFDLNPEGIGVQPMIANVTLGFSFIGGHGLAQPIAKLQNALSFNYYANTEMYDERAEVTEDISTIYDAQTLDDIKNLYGIVSPAERPQTNDGGVTIGTIMSTTFPTPDSTQVNKAGTIKYRYNMKNLVNKVKDYSNTVYNKLYECNKTLLLGGLLILTKDRNFKEGYFDNLTGDTSHLTNIFGRVDGIQQKIQDTINGALEDVDNGYCPLISDVESKNFKNSEIRKIKNRIKELINEKQGEILGTLENYNNDITKIELELISFIDQLNYVCSGVDGYINTQGTVFAYTLTGRTSGVDPSSTATDTFSELKTDYYQVSTDLNTFISQLISNDIIVEKTDEVYQSDFVFNSFIDEPSRISAPDNRFFILFGGEILTSPSGFISKVVQPVQQEQSNVEWNTYISQKVGWDVSVNISNGTASNQPTGGGLYSQYKMSKDITDKRFETFKTTYFQDNMENYKPFNLDKERLLDYSSEIPTSSSSETNLKNVWSDLNSIDDKFNLKKSFY
jgi:hypothetical protein